MEVTSKVTEHDFV